MVIKNYEALPSSSIKEKKDNHLISKTYKSYKRNQTEDLNLHTINNNKTKSNSISFELDTIITEEDDMDYNDYSDFLTLNTIPQTDNSFTINTILNDKDVIVPDVSDKDTILNLAKIAQNAYVRDPTYWRLAKSFGWDDDYIRGHIFKNDLNKLIIISIKGTSSAGLPGSGGEQDTIENDKYNDNLLFSCCCARVTYLWTPVCDCYLDSYTCDEMCLETNIRNNSHYYKSSCQLYRTVANKYPEYALWTVGHSLGGSLASLLARTYGLVGVAFEAPGELLPSQRLHLPLPNDSNFDYIWHVGNNADPIYMGTCNGASSSCNLAGYAMESKCHTGWEITYDTIKELKWGVDIRKHRIKTVIDKVIDVLDVPEAKFTGNGKGNDACIECYDWEFVRGKPSSTVSLIEPSTTTQRTTSTLTTFLSSSCVGRNFVGWCTSYTTF
ncbi:hypothetical protein ACO0SA_003550 [Hanseniaspora valbyensis]